MSKYKNKFYMDSVRKHWNKVSEEYDDINEEIDETHTQRFREAIKYMDLEKDNKILNIWSRTGKAIEYLRGKCQGISIINIELSEGMLKQAKKRYPDEIFLQSSLHTIPCKDNIFDFVLSLETLEHVPDPFLFLLEVKRVLKPRGRLVMSLPPHRVEIYNKVVDLSIAFKIDLHHSEGPRKNISSKIVKKMIEEVGLKLIKHKGTVLIPVGPKFLKNFGMKIEDKIQNTPLREFCIRQFYICEKVE